MTDETIVESILEPSKVIAKGFASKVIVDIDGRTLVGPVIKETDDEIVLGDYSGQGKEIKIAVDDIDVQRDSKISGMPDNLIDELKNRQQFLDLLKYVIDTKERGSDQGAANTGVAKRELTAPRLKWSAKWVNPQYLEDYIADPNHAKAGTKMPQMLGHLDRATREKTAKELAHFILAQSTNQYKSQPIDPQAVKRGYEKFNSVGCIACHAPRDQNAVEIAMEDSKPLGDLSTKYNLSGLIDFLENPISVAQVVIRKSIDQQTKSAWRLRSWSNSTKPIPTKAVWRSIEVLRQSRFRIFI